MAWLPISSASTTTAQAEARGECGHPGMAPEKEQRAHLPIPARSPPSQCGPHCSASGPGLRCGAPPKTGTQSRCDGADPPTLVPPLQGAGGPQTDSLLCLLHTGVPPPSHTSPKANTGASCLSLGFRNAPGSGQCGSMALREESSVYVSVSGGPRAKFLTSSVTPITPSFCSLSPRLATASLEDLPCISATWARILFSSSCSCACTSSR